MKNFCPACQTELDFLPWDGDAASFEICPYCAIQFGYTDAAGGSREKRSKIYALWRDAWIANGKRPLSDEQRTRVIAAAFK